MTVKKKEKLHFGVLISNIDDPCQYTNLQGINDFAEQNDINLSIYVGTCHMPERGNVSHCKTCLDLMKENDSLDGLLLFAGYIGHIYDNEKIEDHVRELSQSKPTVTFAFPAPGIPTVLVENLTGTYDVVTHLIKEHGKREIVFIEGPKGNREGAERLLGYKKALEENDLVFDERYVLPGDFVRTSGPQAVAELIDNRNLPFDAIAVSNDDAAIGAIEALGKRGILVPRDVAVVGFDDNLESATHIPSLSTARQDFYEQGRQGTQMLYRKVMGETVAEKTHINPILVVRQSCGCVGKDIDAASHRELDAKITESSLKEFVLREFRAIFEGEAAEDIVETWANELVKQITKDPFSQECFCRVIDGYLIDYNFYSGELSKWFEALNVLTFGVQKFSTEIANIQAVIPAVIFAATLINNIRVKGDITKEHKKAATRYILRQTTSSLAQTNDVEAIADVLCKLLPGLSMTAAIIGLYKGPVTLGEGETVGAVARAVGFCDGEKINLQYSEEKPVLFTDYPSIGIKYLNKRRSVFIFPLFFEEEDLGLLLLPYEANVSSNVYESLRVNISSSAKGSQLVEKIYELSMTDELTGLLNRRGFLEFAYSRLKHLRRDELKVAVVLFMDLDGLKQINDTFGHREGDTALRAFSAILKKTLRTEDIAGRVGGDEFIVLATVRADEDSALLENRLRKNIDDYNKQGNHQYKISASIGCSVLEVTTKEKFDAALLGADNVLYEEKEKKRAQKGIILV